MNQFYKLKCNQLQLEQINLGLAAKIDVSIYNDPNYTWEHMECIRLLLQDGIDPAPILNTTLGTDEWNTIATELHNAAVNKI